MPPPDRLPDRTREALHGAEPRSPLDWAATLRDADLPALVRQALSEGRARLAFQPVVTAREPARVAFHEGLIRLLDASGALLPAGAFIASVEDSGLGREVDCVALRLAVDTLRRHPQARLSVNMSARSIGDGAWRHALEGGLAVPGLADRLVLEISEASAMLLPDVVQRFMAEMQPKGVSFALDDFGAGLVAFRHLKDFLFDCVKVERAVVAGVDASPDAQVLAGALISVARQFGMFAVASGVETEGEARTLRALRADCLQGFLFGRPRPRL